MSDLSGRTTIVVGASRGLGRGIATAFAEAGAPVVAVSRTAAAFPAVQAYAARAGQSVQEYVEQMGPAGRRCHPGDRRHRCGRAGTGQMPPTSPPLTC
jgi:NAD(P)-dependent dehydrogenase (short-subunit alcohol dehydrogenase family)